MIGRLYRADALPPSGDAEGFMIKLGAYAGERYDVYLPAGP
jgi:hypothetical protein